MVTFRWYNVISTKDQIDCTGFHSTLVTIISDVLDGKQSLRREWGCMRLLKHTRSWPWEEGEGNLRVP